MLPPPSAGRCRRGGEAAVRVPCRLPGHGGGCPPAGRAGGSRRGSAGTAPALTERDPPEQVCRAGSPSPRCLRLHPWQETAILGFPFQGYFWRRPPHADGSGPASPGRPCGRAGRRRWGPPVGREGEGAARTPLPPRLPRGARAAAGGGRRGLSPPASGPAGAGRRGARPRRLPAAGKRLSAPRRRPGQPLRERGCRCPAEPQAGGRQRTQRRPPPWSGPPSRC